MDDEGNADVYFVERNAVQDRVRRPTVISTSRSPAYHPPAAVPTGTRVTYGGPATFGGPAQFAPAGVWAGNNDNRAIKAITIAIDDRIDMLATSL